MNVLSKDSNYSLSNKDNYNKELCIKTEEIIDKYSLLIIEYYTFIIDNLKIKNNNYVTFIITRGLDTITHVFLNLLLYTKNIDLTYFHCQKSFYFYVEFVGQISEDEKMFLQLTSRDATTYVYKKTIFDINTEIKKNSYMSDLDKQKIDIINVYVKIYKLILQKIIASNIKNDNTYNLKTTELINSIEQIYYRLNYEFKNKLQTHNIESNVSNLYDTIEDASVFIETVKQMLKQTKKYKHPST
jgi:hypothetical protein